ncbi:MAG TPA: amidohydrolase family protein [Patescibacteria group bacterium]|nr:amidohydrolase family protein [Patescibacteria group bacterium]
MNGETVVRGRLVLDERVHPGRIVVRDGWIAEVELDPAESGGPLVAPGFVDVHVHGRGGHDAMGPDGALDGMARALLRHGVTSFLPTAVTAPLGELASFAERVRRWIPAAPDDGAGPLGFNLEGPFLNHAQRGAQNPAHIVVPADVTRADFEPLLDGLRLITIAPEVPGALDLIGWLRARGVTVSLGHSAATVAEGQAGYAAGARTTTHLFNGMTGVDHHAPGLAVAALLEDDAYVELIADGHHVHDAIWPLIVRAKPADRLLLVSDCVAIAGTGERGGMLGGLEVVIEDDRCLLASDGRLAGSVIALDSAVRNLARSGVALPRAVAAASRQPLDLLGVSDRGRVEAGQRADLVELDDDLRVCRVMRGGRWFPGPG